MWALVKLAHWFIARGGTMKTYRHDRYWTTARYLSHCRECKSRIVPSHRIWYYPKDKAVCCETCGQAQAARFYAEITDEEMLSR
jgi:hypothetical protein